MKLLEFFPSELKKQLSKRQEFGRKDSIKEEDFAFPKVRKLPLVSHRNILSAMTHFFNVKGVNAEDRKEAYKKIIERSGAFKICTMGFIERCKGLFKD